MRWLDIASGVVYSCNFNFLYPYPSVPIKPDFLPIRFCISAIQKAHDVLPFVPVIPIVCKCLEGSLKNVWAISPSLAFKSSIG